MTETTIAQNELVRQFKAARRVSTPLIAISTPDPAATQALLCEAINGEAAKLSWDIARGVDARNEQGVSLIAELGGDDFVNRTKGDPVTMLVEAASLPGLTMLFFHNAHRYLDDATVAQAVWNLRDEFKQDKRTLILLAPSLQLPAELQGDVVELDEPLPDDAQMREIVREQFDAAGDAIAFEVTDDLVASTALALKGAKAYAGEQLAAMSIRKDGVDRDYLTSQARKIVEQTQGITFERGGETFDDIGGLAFAKQFGERLFNGPRPPAVIVRVEELEKSLAGARGDLSGTSGDALQVILSEMEDNNWTGILAYGPPGCQPAGEPVLMADGSWKPVEQIKLGDLVLSPQLDGSTIVAPVISTAQHANQPIFEVKQRGIDRRSYLASGDHILPMIGVENRRISGTDRRKFNYQKYVELTVDQFQNRGARFRNKARIFTNEAIDVWAEIDAPIPPYSLGCFLGDGGWSPAKGAAPAFTTSEDELIDAQHAEGIQFGKRYHRSGSVRVNYVRESRIALRSLGLEGKRSKEKFVPRQYLTGSLAQRLDLLAGLIDTDGTATEFSTIAPQLAKDFAWLVHSVGGKARIREVNWDDKMGRHYRVFRVPFQFVAHHPLCVLKRKRQKQRNVAWKDPRRRAFDVSYHSHGTVYGFTLASPTGLYITRDYLVTHNSGKSLYSKSLANTFGAKAIRFDPNATKGSLVGQSEQRIRAAMKVIKTIGGERVFFVASVNRLEALPPELQRRFRCGVWFFDVPDDEERAAIWAINRQRFGIAGDDPSPDEADLTGADIRNICDMAETLSCTLREALEFVVPLKKQSPSAIRDARELAHGRFLSATKGGVYEGDARVRALAAELCEGDPGYAAVWHWLRTQGLTPDESAAERRARFERDFRGLGNSEKMPAKDLPTNPKTV